MIETAIRTILATADAVKAKATGGIHFNAAPQDERRPRVVLTTVTHTNYHDFDGNVGYSDGNVQVDCYADTYRTAKELADAAAGALDNYSGTVAGTNVGLIEITDQSDIPSAPLAGQAVPQFGVSLDASFLTL